ncbi:hypothetical protein [Enterobacter roggenkampii]|uniref:hypothetical protein n=1 Tax=Enterobacter roggenkampii TaxID=1812935 RepID=UPI003891100E
MTEEQKVLFLLENAVNLIGHLNSAKGTDKITSHHNDGIPNQIDRAYRMLEQKLKDKLEDIK